MLKQKSFTEHFSLYFILLVLPFQLFANTNNLDEVTSGVLMAKTSDGIAQSLPMVKADVDIKVTGPIARTVLTQTFKNPGDDWIEAIYAFPLPEKAAVDHLDLVVGERVIQGQIKEKQKAKKIYNQAMQQGKKAALVEQHRPNLFTTSVANIPPNGKIEIKLQYQQQLNWRDNGFSLRYPMAITPRYVPADQLPPSENIEFNQQISEGWSVLPGEVSNMVSFQQENAVSSDTASKTSIRVVLNAGFPIENLVSRYHQVNQNQLDQGEFEIVLADSSVEPDRDFVLDWKPVAGHLPKAAFFKEQVKNDEGVEELSLIHISEPTRPTT